MSYLENLEEIRQTVYKNGPLIHCITNPISINDCANAVLALGAKPIMAEHPKEAAGITDRAGALAVNLGNITDARAESIMISGEAAKKKSIPSIIDVVGTTCSTFRMELAAKYIRECSPAVIKGNLSEIKAVAGVHYEAVGIDAAGADMLDKGDKDSVLEAAKVVKEYAAFTKSTVLASGAIDIISDGSKTFCVSNGVSQLSQVTGTGCMLNVITAVYLSAAEPLKAALIGAVTLGVSGELALAELSAYKKGNRYPLGSFHVKLIDKLSVLTSENIYENMKIDRI